ncbi:Probable ABC transporter ATP-binding protein NosF [Geodia barretti]|uniref:Probable ABC transporter ATP-binding protein NosF n=1 Tax=Geodia barretti TaxID=519541 RepID=A0AA35RFV2_GEOBA|nr:Probable ABC transporter ATP-binding protein NosF [Geodia barretti]
MKLFLGLLTPTSGTAEVLGEKPYENVEVRVRLGYMPEHDCLPDAITASEFLGHMAQMSGIPAVTARTAPPTSSATSASTRSATATSKSTPPA